MMNTNTSFFLNLTRNSLWLPGLLFMVLYGLTYYFFAQNNIWQQIYLLVPVVFLSIWFLKKKRNVFWIILILPAIIPEISNDVRLAADRTIFYSYKLLGVLNIYDFSFLGVILFWFINRVVNRKLKFDRPIDVPLLGFLFVALISLAVGYMNQPENIRLMFYEFINITRFVLVYFVAVDLLRHENDSKRLLWFWSACAIINGIAGIYRYMNNMGVDLYQHQQKVLFIDPGINAIFMVSIIFCIGILFKKITWRKSVFLFMAFIPIIFSFIFSYRRGLWVGAVTAFLVLLCLNKWPAKVMILKKSVVLITLFIALVLCVGLINPRMTDSVKYSYNRVRTIKEVKVKASNEKNLDSSNYYRIIDMFNAVESIKNKPWWGIGLGGYYDIFYGSQDMHAYRVAKLNNVSHNSYLFFWMKMGIGAIVFFLWAIFEALRHGIAGLFGMKENYRRDLLIVSISILVGCMVVLLTGPLFMYAGGANVLGVILAFIMNFIKENKEFGQSVCVS